MFVDDEKIDIKKNYELAMKIGTHNHSNQMKIANKQIKKFFQGNKNQKMETKTGKMKSRFAFFVL